MITHTAKGLRERGRGKRFRDRLLEGKDNEKDPWQSVCAPITKTATIVMPLTADVVTVNVDVREAAAQFPEETPAKGKPAIDEKSETRSEEESPGYEGAPDEE